MTRITKYAQSCFLLEKDGKRLLLDPGRFDIDLHNRKPGDWPKIDLVLVTHEHFDHAHLETLLFLVERDRCPIYTNASFAKKLADLGLKASVLTPGTTTEVAGFRVTGIRQQHGELSGGRPIPEDIGFVIDQTFYTTGDSVVVSGMPHVPVLFVPVAGPQMNFDSARMMIDTVKPKLAVAMHYSNTANYPIDIEELRRLKFDGTDFLVIEDGQSFTWPR